MEVEGGGGGGAAFNFNCVSLGESLEKSLKLVLRAQAFVAYATTFLRSRFYFDSII